MSRSPFVIHGVEAEIVLGEWVSLYSFIFLGFGPFDPGSRLAVVRMCARGVVSACLAWSVRSHLQGQHAQTFAARPNCHEFF
jgi:hypothetical protein